MPDSQQQMKQTERLFISTPVLHFKKASQSQFVPDQQSRIQLGKLQFFSSDLKVVETEKDWQIHTCGLQTTACIEVLNKKEQWNLVPSGINGLKHSESV